MCTQKNCPKVMMHMKVSFVASIHQSDKMWYHMTDTDAKSWIPILLVICTRDWGTTDEINRMSPSWQRIISTWYEQDKWTLISNSSNIHSLVAHGSMHRYNYNLYENIWWIMMYEIGFRDIHERWLPLEQAWMKSLLTCMLLSPFRD